MKFILIQLKGEAYRAINKSLTADVTFVILDSFMDIFNMPQHIFFSGEFRGANGTRMFSCLLMGVLRV